jgi:hypothetical protein
MKGSHSIHALPRVQPYTFRPPEYQLSCAQDWRKGLAGYQQHIWTAVLDEQAQVFTTGIHPAQASRVSRWAGNGSLPRAMAHRNVLIAIYNIADNDHSERASHAWFPRFAFDEFVESGSWIFGRKKNAYVGLFSLIPAKWMASDNEFLSQILIENPSSQPYDYFADGLENVWVCQLGSASEFGGFPQFVDAVSKSHIGGDILSFRYNSPKLGEITTGWDSPFVVGGRTIDLRPKKRFANPYCQAEFNSRKYTFQIDGQSLQLDFSPERSS